MWSILEAVAVIIVLAVASAVVIPRFLASQNNINTPQRIPDPNFRAFIEEYMGVKPGAVITKEQTAFSNGTLDCSDREIESLKGIEYFVNIKSVKCSNNELTNIDISKNVKLEALNCTRNLLSTLDLSNNKTLRFLYCDYNQFTSIDVSYNPLLINVGINFNRMDSISNFRELKKLTLLFAIGNHLNHDDIDDVQYFIVVAKIMCGMNFVLPPKRWALRARFLNGILSNTLETS